MDQFHSAQHVASTYATSIDPVRCHRPHAAHRGASWFKESFPGSVFYAVKANPHPMMIDAIAAAGINHFDVASLQEVRDIRAQIPGAVLGYLHPVKPEAAIAEAYETHGVRIFALDSEAELDKILRATGNAGDLTLCVRLAVDNSHAEMSLGRKFGATAEVAVPLLRRTRMVARELGICFHTGSQMMVPGAFDDAMSLAEEMLVASGVMVDIVDVGGGFPARYPGLEPPSMGHFTNAVQRRWSRFLAPGTAQLWCEPGRAIVAEAMSLIARVDGRRGNELYINDGVYGTLFDAGQFAWRYPVRRITPAWMTAGRDDTQSPLADFALYGPTCDDADYMKGPFPLPADIAEGDLIEIGMLGAYGATMATTFNGFGTYTDVICTDDPFGTIYDTQRGQRAIGGLV